LAPLTDVARIRRRHDQVELFVVHARLREQLREALSELRDIERLSVRAALGEANPRDLGGLRDGLSAAARALAVLSDLRDPELREVLGLSDAPIDTLPELHAELERALVERPSPLAKQGEIFRPEFDAELDELDGLRRTGTERMVELEAKLRESTGIATLRIKFTRVFGWYIEVSRGQSGRVPPQFRRKQTVASGERYTTPEVDELSDKLSHAEERHRERELALLNELVKTSGRAASRIATLSERLSGWDVAAALADVAHRHDYVRPKIDESDVLSLRDARHPVVERLSARGKFVPNDVELDLSGERLWLVTGPNMAGKSTLLRQVALCTILAQMGSFVPARAARIGVVDRVLSRVGASDNLAAGESTFMVEMRETAEILRSATRRSLVILDEIGRGTSTFDGLSMGGGRVSGRGRGLPRLVRDALPRADEPVGAERPRGQLQRERPRAKRRRRVLAPVGARRGQSQLWGGGGEAGRLTRARVGARQGLAGDARAQGRSERAASWQSRGITQSERARRDPARAGSGPSHGPGSAEPAAAFEVQALSREALRAVGGSKFSHFTELRL
jgi:DNA mismatch repair protein MutS